MTRLPKRFGRWRVVSVLGIGGMGTVYLAESRGHRAAVKVIHPGYAHDEAFRRRFRREVEIARLVVDRRDGKRSAPDP